MCWRDQIELNPAVLVGKPVVRGTRLSVEFIIQMLADNWSIDEVLSQYPGLTRDDVLACLHYASHWLQTECVYPLEQ